MKRLLLAVFVASLAIQAIFSQGTLSPAPRFTAFDNNGLIIAGGKLCTYTAGTTTPQATYSDSALLVPNTNPVVMDSAGRAIVYLSQSSYKFTLYSGGTLATCDGTQLWSQDNISATPTTSGNVDVAGIAGENIAAGQAAYLSDGSGGKNAGQWYKADSGNPYSSTLPPLGMATAAITSGSSGTVRIGGSVSGLTVTAGTDYYVGSAGAISSTLTSNGRLIGRALTNTSLVLTNAPLSIPVDVIGTAGATITAGQAVYLSDGSGALTAGLWYPGDSTNPYSSSNALETGIAPVGISSLGVGLIRVKGLITTTLSLVQPSLVAGTRYYVSTSGNLTSVKPTNSRYVGAATSTSSLAITGSLPSGELPGSMTLLHTGQGTDTSAGATNVDTYALNSQLTDKDTLYISFTLQNTGANGAIVTTIINSTDTVTLQTPSTVNNSYRINQLWSRCVNGSPTLVSSVELSSAFVAPVAVTFTTNFTGAWTIALHHAGVTAGDSLKWSWQLYRIAGQ